MVFNEKETGGNDLHAVWPVFANSDKLLTKNRPGDSEMFHQNLFDLLGRDVFAPRDETVKIGNYARGGKTRGDHRVADHDMGGEEKYIPFGLVEEDSGQVHLTFGSFSKTSDFIVDSLQDW
jgi:hypothetical protein